MGILAWLILGAVSGWLASLIVKTDAQQGLIANIVVGIIGAVVGGFLFENFGKSKVDGLNIYSLVVATVGAVVLLAVYKAITGRR